MKTCKSDDTVTVKQNTITGYDGYKLPVLIIEPAHVGEKLPCILFCHGGGLMLKAAEAHYQFAKWYVQRANCKVLLPGIRRRRYHDI